MRDCILTMQDYWCMSFPWLLPKLINQIGAWHFTHVFICNKLCCCLPTITVNLSGLTHASFNKWTHSQGFEQMWCALQDDNDSIKKTTKVILIRLITCWNSTHSWVYTMLLTCYLCSFTCSCSSHFWHDNGIFWPNVCMEPGLQKSWIGLFLVTLARPSLSAALAINKSAH